MSSPISSPPVSSPPTTPTTTPPVTSPPDSPPPTSPPSSPPPDTQPPSSQPPPSSDPRTSIDSPPPTSAPPSSDAVTTPPPTSTTSESSTVISTPVTTVVTTSLVQTSPNGQVFTTVIETSSVLPPGSTIGVNPNNRATPSSSNTGAIVGGVVGGLAGLAILLIALFYLIRRHNRAREFDFDGNFDPDRFTSGGKYAPGGGGGGTLPNIRVDDEGGLGAGVGVNGGSPPPVGPNRASLSSSGHLGTTTSTHPNANANMNNINGEMMREWGDDDGVGGRLAGSAIGAGVVTPFMLGRPPPAAAGGSFSNLPPGAGAGTRPAGVPGRGSVPVGGYFPSEKQRLAALYAQQQQQQQNQQNPPPSLHQQGSPPRSPSATATSTSMYPQSQSTHAGGGAFVGGFASPPSPPNAGGGRGGTTGYESSESHYAPTNTNTGTTPTATSDYGSLSTGAVVEKQREAMERFGGGRSVGGLGVVNPDEEDGVSGPSQPSNPNTSANVVVHRDAGRLKADEAAEDEARRRAEEVDEIPPTYESIAGGGERR